MIESNLIVIAAATRDRHMKFAMAANMLTTKI